MTDRICQPLSLGVCLLLAGCATQQPGIGEPGPDGVAYLFELASGPRTAVRVTLRVRGEADGASRLAVAPSWGGVENCERFVHDLRVCDGEGRECEVTTTADAPHGWDVTHERGAMLTAWYELRPSDPDPLAQFRTHYEPVVRADLLHLIGETGLIYPEWLEGRGPIDIRVSFSGFRERGWSVATSFDADLEGGKGTLRRSLQEFRHAMFLAGPEGRVRVHDRDIRGGKLRVAIFGDDWGFKDPEMVNLVERIVAVEREFVDDFADPYFLVTVAPTGPRATPQSVSQGGTGLTNCFALFLAPGTAVGTDSPHRNHVLRLLAHEYFHTWNGGGGEITMEDPEELVYWFSEGFTDFYASRLLRRAGLIDDTEWTTRLNETLKKLWLNLAATEPAETIRREFWSRREVQELPYNRGEAVALMLDEEIRRVSGGAKSLDGFFLETLDAARSGEKAQTDRLLSRVARWTSAEFAASVRAIVVDGAMPQPPARVTEPAATRTDHDTHRYDPGFDVDRSLDAKAAVGVREGGPAHAAGLREGQAITGFSVYRGDPEREIKLNVREGDQTRSVKFFPHGEAVRIPRYQLGG